MKKFAAKIDLSTSIDAWTGDMDEMLTDDNVQKILDSIETGLENDFPQIDFDFYRISTGQTDKISVCPFDDEDDNYNYADLDIIEKQIADKIEEVFFQVMENLEE